MEVRHDEGVANHIGPEPCAISREGEGEASVGEFTGQPLSRARIDSGRRRRCEGGRQRMRHVIARISSARRGRRTWHMKKLLVREPGDPMFGKQSILRVIRDSRSIPVVGDLHARYEDRYQENERYELEQPLHTVLVRVTEEQ